jgi:hypothetical protein
MSGKRVWLASLGVVLLGLGAARAQAPTYGTEVGGQPSASPAVDPAAPFVDFGAIGLPPGDAAAQEQRLYPLSEWLQYPRSPGCCGPTGNHGPIGFDVYARSGLVWPLGHSILEQSLLMGWQAEIGARTLFWNPSQERAWAVGLSISNIYNPRKQFNLPTVNLLNVKVNTTQAALQAQAGTSTSTSTAANQSSNTPITIVVPQVTVSVADLNESFLNFFGGQEWYLIGSGNCSECGWNWRAGWDIGGSWGSAKIEYNEIRHQTGVIGGIFGAVHTDVEKAWHCAILSAGIRAQFNYIWTDLLQDNPADIPSFGLLFTVGARF